MDANTWPLLERIRECLDERDGLAAERDRRFLRLLKIGEEFGQPGEAVLGALSLTEGGTREDARQELCDVAITALVALVTLRADAEMDFDQRLWQLVYRLQREQVASEADEPVSARS